VLGCDKLADIGPLTAALSNKAESFPA
jgi:hypothetical protein